MLKLLLGIDWKENRNAVLRAVAEDVAAGTGNRVLIVPELISHDMEKRLCETSGDSSCRFAEVLSFTRLTSRVADTVGHNPRTCMDDGGRIVAMAAAVQQAQSRLKAYASVGTRPDFFTGLLEAVDEFKRCCITPETLMEASKSTEGSFAQKLEELSLLFECYNSVCGRGKLDPRDQMTWLLEELEDSDYAKQRVFYIDGFPDFTRQHLAIIEHLICEASCVTVSLTTDAVRSGAIAFEKAGETAGILLEMAKKHGVEVAIEYIPAKDNPLVPVCTGLFQGAMGPSCRQVTLYAAESVYRECVDTSERILELVYNGARYRDISVVCGDVSAYKNTLQMVFERCGIPCYISGTEAILEKSVVATVLAAIDTAISDFDQKEVLRYLKSSLSPLRLELCDEVESYVFLWGISGKRWLEEWTYHPDGLGGTWSEDNRRTLDKLNNARRLALQPLAALRKGLLQSRKLSEQVRALYDFFEEIQLSQHMQDLAQQMESCGDHRGAQILNQLWDILIGAMEQLHETLGETAWSADCFSRLFKLLLSQYSVGTIPHVLDAVTVGPVSAMRCQECEHLFVVGASEGALPGYSGSTGVLTDQERTQLRTMGVPLTGGAVEGLQNEFAEIYGVFCGANKRITVSCSGGQPSFVYQRLLQVSSGEQTHSLGLGSALTNKADAAAFVMQYGCMDSVRQLAIENEYAALQNKCAHDLGAVGKENVQNLYGEKLRLSASQVDRHGECRLSYFLRYGLRVKEWKSVSVDPAEFGTYVHAVLENTVSEVMRRGGFADVSLADTLSIAAGYSDQYVKERFSDLDTERLTYLFRRNSSELAMIVEELWNELSASAFIPQFFELEFGDTGKLPAISIPGRAMDAQLRGFVDRVDVWDDGENAYVRVVDYKTGAKDFDYCDVFNGLGLQMLLYLFALENCDAVLTGKKMHSAGVQYFPARAPMINADGLLTDEESAAARSKEWKRKGLLLGDESVLQAMEPGEKPLRLPYSRKKDGTISGDLASREDLAILKQHVFDLLGKLVDEIASGCVTANPYTRGESHNACRYCPYGAVCHVADVEGRRNYKKMSADEFWERIRKEAGENG